MMFALPHSLLCELLLVQLSCIQTTILFNLIPDHLAIRQLSNTVSLVFRSPPYQTADHRSKNELVCTSDPRVKCPLIKTDNDFSNKLHIEKSHWQPKQLLFRGSEWRTSSVFEWFKIVWLPNGLLFKP